MSVIIHGLNLPLSKTELIVFPSGVVQVYDSRENYLGKAQAVPIPEGHGKLGDLDKLEENLRMAAAYQTGERQQGILGCCETIRMAKPIIPAEGGTGDDGNA